MLLDELQTRYELKSRKGIYARINALNLQLPKDSKRRSYATEQMVQQLDDLDAHLKSGGELKSYVPTTHTEVMSDVTVPHMEVSEPHGTNELLPNEVTPGNITNTNDLLPNQVTLGNSNTNDLLPDMLPEEVTLLPQLLSVIQNLTNNHDPLMPNRLLAEAADRGYILTSKQIKDILGIKPKGSSFTRLGFSFTKIGKDGAYSSWSVERYEA